ncbi:MAG TPA: DUF5050 domain-containing protein, partial [Herpetosiphonaceae bacterium]|nr:DUF5050 domain-containing protein [Herpetosiphonaceae bacterium]
MAAVLAGLLGATVPALAVVPGQNGKIAFTSLRDGLNYDIYAMNADGTGQTALTSNAGFNVHPAWSPDGSKIAFVSTREGDSEIYVMNANGSEQMNLTSNAASDYWPAWSPDGSKIAFESNYEIYVMNADGSEQTRLTTFVGFDSYPAWSPDGSKIAFVSTLDGDYEIYVMNADGSEQTNLTNNAAKDIHPDWSPDGSKIAFQSYRDGDSEIYVMNADGSEQMNLTSNAVDDTYPVWSPDGSKIAFESYRDGDSEIYVMNADGSEQTSLTSNAVPDLYPAWQSVTASNTPPSIDSFTAPADPVAAGTPVAVAATFTDADTGDTHSALIEWGDGTSSPGTVSQSSGSGLVSGSHTYSVAGTYTLELTVTDGEGAADSEVFQYVVVYDPLVAPGRNGKIAFMSERDGNPEIYVMNADG